MAAPSGTKWGSVKSGGQYLKGRIGLYITTSSTTTQTTATVQVWFWSIYSITDVKNTLYLSNNSSSATKSRGNVSISTTVNSGGGWSTSNQEKLGTWTFTMDRKASKRTIDVAAKLSTIDVIGSSMYVSSSYTVPALPKYTLTYNANGGSDAPEADSLSYNVSTKISNGIPFRSGYTFLGWSTSSSATTATYSPGSTIKITSNTTLYAVWQAVSGTKKVTIFYNLNGGEGNITSSSANSGATFTIVSTKPTREGYNFKGWSMYEDGSGTLYVGGNTLTLTESITLYAAWEASTGGYTVTYNANGGSNAPSAQTKIQKKILKLTSLTPIRSGYLFKGWGTAASEDSDDFEMYYPQGYYREDASITLYAIWTDMTEIHFTGGGDIEAGMFVESTPQKPVYGFTKGTVFAPVFNEVEEGSIQFKKDVIMINDILEI